MLALLAVAAAVAMLTWIVGWWGVAVAALIGGVLLHRRPRAALLVALAASIAGAMRVPVPALLVVTLLFGALLAWSAAVVGTEAGRLARGTRPPA